LIKQAMPDTRVAVQSFEGLLAEFGKKVGASVITAACGCLDFEYEFRWR